MGPGVYLKLVFISTSFFNAQLVPDEVRVAGRIMVRRRWERLQLAALALRPSKAARTTSVWVC